MVRKKGGRGKKGCIQFQKKKRGFEGGEGGGTE